MAADIERGAGIDGQRDAEQRVDGKRGGDDGIGRAVVAPGMAAGACDGDLKTAAAKSLRDDVVVAGAIESDEAWPARARGICGGIAGREMLAVEVADAAQIAFAFFADIGDEEQGSGGDDCHLVEGCGQGPESGESGAVVTDAGTEQTGLLALERRQGVEAGKTVSR